MKQPHVIFSVTNDIVTDQRVLRTANYLFEKGYAITIIGRKLPNSLALPENTDYQFYRLQLFFNQGPLFYLEYNLRLFGLLLSLKKTHLHSVDLDTLLPNFMIKLFENKNVELIYDAHEYFTGVPELINHPTKRKIWKFIEKLILPRLNRVLTVNESLARCYQEEYNIEVASMRNIGDYSNINKKDMPNQELPNYSSRIILQGAGINVDRGAEEAIESMQYIDDAALMIVGSGDAIPNLHQMVDELGLDKKVYFFGKKTYHELLAFTRAADVGLSLDKGESINYRISLPNKIFDYIHSNTAIVASDLIEISSIISNYQVGAITPSHDPKTIANTIQRVLEQQKNKAFQEGFLRAQKELNWSIEAKKLNIFYE